MTDGLYMVLANFPSPVTLGLLAVLGAVVGSFLNVVIVRIPQMMDAEKGGDINLAYPSSSCPHCGHAIRAHHNIPIFSFIMLRGRCFDCRAAISARYPFIEALSAVAAVALGLNYGLEWPLLAAFVFVCFGLCIGVIDFNTFLIPDRLSYPLIALGLVVNSWGLFSPIVDAVIGAIGGFVSLWLISAVAEYILKKEAMGKGDFKLFAGIGAWVGWQMMPVALLVACVIGSIIGLGLRYSGKLEAGEGVPFGPFLVIGGIVSLVWGHDIVNAYVSHILMIP